MRSKESKIIPSILVLEGCVLLLGDKNRVFLLVGEGTIVTAPKLSHQQLRTRCDVSNDQTVLLLIDGFFLFVLSEEGCSEKKNRLKPSQELHFLREKQKLR